LEVLLRPRIGFRVDLAGFLPGQSHPSEHPADAVGMHGFAEPGGDPNGQCVARPGAYAIDLRIRATVDGIGQDGLLRFRQPFRPMAFRPIEQPCKSLSVVAQDGVAQRLTLHPGEPRRLGPAQPIQSVRDRIGS